MRAKPVPAPAILIMVVLTLAALLPLKPGLAIIPNQSAAAYASNGGDASARANLAGASHAQALKVATTAPNSVTTVTVTVTNTTTTTVTVEPPLVTDIIVNVQNQYGLWINGAQVDVLQIEPGTTPQAYTLAANGTTSNGQFVATNVTADSVFSVQVYAPDGASANQTVTVGVYDAIVNFVIPTSAAPNLSLQNVTLDANASSPGSPFTLTADVVNTSNSTAYNSVLTVTPPAQFSLLNTGSDIPLGNLAGGADTPLTLLMSVSSVTAIPGYTLGYTLNFTDYLGLSYTVAGSISLPSPPPPSLVIQNVTLTPTVIQPGTTFSVTADVVNSGNSTAYNAMLKITHPADISLLGTGSVISVGALQPGASKSLSLHLIASNNVASTANTISYSLTYTDYFLNKENTTGNLFVPISGNPLSPKLIVTSATFSSAAIHPGENFTVPIVIQNVASIPASEVVLSVNATSPLFTTGSAGDYRLGVVSGNGTVSVKLGFASPPSASLGSYPITLTLAYEDEFGSLYTSSQVLVATLVGEPSLVFNELQFKSNPLTPGLQTFLNAQILNTGGESALNVKVSFQDAPSFLSNTTIFLGSIAPSKVGNATSYLQIPSAMAVGSYQFNAVISYTDSTGEAYEVEAPYTVTVAPFSPPSVSVTNTLLSPEVLSAGTQGTLTIYYKNQGSSTADDLVLTLINGSSLFTSNYFGLGALGPGDSGTTTVGVNVAPKLRSGDYQVKILATYTDQNGVNYNSTLPLEITVYAAANLLTLKNIAIGGAIVVIAVVAYAGFTFIRKRARTSTD